jgi:threonine/homoserine/homoserine lactone efflux protein
MSFIAFLVAATILAITPGPGIAYVVARTVAGGRSEGLASCMGTGLGGMLHVLAAAHRLLASGVARAARARLMTRISGATMIGLGVFLATAKRQT